MLTHPSALAIGLAAAGNRAPLNGHLWHTVEALGFLITALGGVAAAEFFSARQRRREVSNARPPIPRETFGVAQSSGVALLPARTAVDTAVDLDAPTGRARTRFALLPLVALAGAAAAAVHFVVMPEHFEEATLYGAFFAVAATSQLLYSVLLLARPSRSLLVAGALGNLAIIVLWLITRTVGIPLGPGAGETESIGGLDILATLFELTTTVGSILLICRPQPLRRAIRPSTWSRPLWLLAPVAAVAIGVTAVIAPPS